MIKYVELTAPESSEFRQVKILSVEVAEGDQVSIGDTLFRVKSGSNEIDLPSTREGRIAEVIAQADENISVMTPLVLIETDVEGSTATPPIIEIENSVDAEIVLHQKVENKAESSKSNNSSKPNNQQTTNTSAKKKRTGKRSGDHQQSLNLNNGHQGDSEGAELHDLEEVVLVNKVDMSDSPANIQTQKSEQEQNPELQQASIDDAAPVKPTVATQASHNSITLSNSMNKLNVVVPDIGTDSAKVIEILVKVGDHVNVEDSLITLESDKASMDVPSPYAGVIESIALAVDQDAVEGSEILVISVTEEQDSVTQQTTTEPAIAQKSNDRNNGENMDNGQQQSNASGGHQITKVVVPDIGGDSAKVIEILVEVGQQIEKEDSLITLESDKASMEVPSSHSGKISSIDVQLDQELSEGSLILTMTTTDAPSAPNVAGASKSASAVAASPSTAASSDTPAAASPSPAPTTGPAGKAHASPSIRRFARELGVDLSQVSGTGRKGRIAKMDVSGFVKAIMTSSNIPAQAAAPATSGIPEVPAVDFSKFGEVDIQPLNKIKRLTAANLHRSWLNVPHVTHADESNISGLEAFRKQLNAEYVQQNKAIKLSPLAFIVKAVVNGLKTYPQFNSSLEPGGQNLIYKKYINIGVAVETPNGLVVPVIKDADKKTVADIAVEMGELATRARDKKLRPTDMSGSCFTISSLGGIGGTHFTPIVNAPEVAILGVSRSKIQPVWNGEEFEPAMILPLSLSYDHRVIDGAEAARFTRHLANILEDVRRLTI